MTTEIWKDIPRYEGFYQISNFGRVRSLDRKIYQSRGLSGSTYSRLLRGRIIFPFVAKGTGYMQISLRKKVRCSMHRLVAMAFCEGYADGLEVNHKNGIRSDNRSENLEWVSRSENILHSFAELGKVPSTLGKFGGKSPAAKPVIATSINTGQVTEFPSIEDALQSGFTRSSIWRCCAGKAKSHKGYSWAKKSKSA